MTLQVFNSQYWKYYLMLENKFINSLPYVTLSEKNYDTFSNEYAHLIQSIGSELDAFFKEYCGFNLTDYKNISDYASYILADWPDIKSQEVRVEQIHIKPFEDWDSLMPRQSLFWWDAFDNIKHSRVANETQGSLKNALYMLAALYMIEMKWYKKTADTNNECDLPSEASKLFVLENWKFNYISLSQAYGRITN